MSRRSARAGFTLMEMLVTLVLISFATLLMFQMLQNRSCSSTSHPSFPLKSLEPVSSLLFL